MAIWVPVSFLSALSSLPILVSPLTSKKYFLPENCSSLYISFILTTFLIPKRWLRGKLPVDQPIWHHTCCNHCHPSSSFWCSVWSSTDCLNHVYMPKRIELVLRSINKLFLTKCLVSVHRSHLGTSPCWVDWFGNYLVIYQTTAGVHKLWSWYFII